MKTEVASNVMHVGESNVSTLARHISSYYSIIILYHREHELEAMRVRSKEMQERVSCVLLLFFAVPNAKVSFVLVTPVIPPQLKAEEEKHENVQRNDSRRDDQKKREDFRSTKPLRDVTDFGDNHVRVMKIVDLDYSMARVSHFNLLLLSFTQSSAKVGLKKNERKSYGRVEDSRSKSMFAKLITSKAERSGAEPADRANVSSKPIGETKNDKVEEQGHKSSSKRDNIVSKVKPGAKPTARAPVEPVDDVNDAIENTVKGNKQNYFTEPSQLTMSSACAKSAIKRKGLKSSKAASSVRFDATADRPKLDVVMSGVVGNDAKTKQTNSNKFSLSISSTQTSGISSCESGGRRRKKASNGGKSKAALLAMKGFDDDGGFL